jgi:hypothetical protein
MSKLWVKFKTNNATKVSTEVCNDVDDFLKACKKELSLLLASYDAAQLSLSTTDGGAALRPGTSLTLIPANTDDCPLFISTVTCQDDMLIVAVPDSSGLLPSSIRVGIDTFLSTPLPDIKKLFSKPTNTGTRRCYPKTPKFVERWKDFLSDAVTYEYPKTLIANDMILPNLTEMIFKLEKDVDSVMQYHLLNLNRIFRDQGNNCRFSSKADVDPETTTQDENSPKLYGVPDFVLIRESKVLSFVECKTANDLPVHHPVNGNLFDLLEIFQEDVHYQQTERVREDMGRMDVSVVIEQIYGYLALNNLI